MNEGVNISSWGQNSPLGTNFKLRAKLRASLGANSCCSELASASLLKKNYISGRQRIFGPGWNLGLMRMFTPSGQLPPRGAL
jgi:hypothetical protein